MTRWNRKRLPRRPRLHTPKFEDARTWKVLLVAAAIAVPAITTLFFWFQTGFKGPMPTEVFGRVAGDPLIFFASMGQVVTFGGISLIFSLSSKEAQRRFLKAVLTLLAAFLTFGGPTYLMLILERLKLPYPLLVVVGLSSFTAGVILFTRLIKEEKET